MPKPSMQRATSEPAQLSLFDDAPAAGTPAVGPTAAPTPAPTPAPTATSPAKPPRPAAGPGTLAPPADDIAAPAFAHPQAQREIALGEHRVAYLLRRARQRSIRFVIGIEGLSVSAPRWVSQADIDAALRAKGRWILRKLHEQRERARRMAASRVQWGDGAVIPFLGETVIVVLDPRATGAVLHTAQDTLPGVSRLTLHVGLPHGAAPEQVRDAVQSWLQRQARRIFEQRCADYAVRLGVRVRRLTLSSASTRWGSASADGSVRLNWRLVHFAMPVIDYVVTHELAHLREMNHSAAFWDVVRSVLPDYEQALGTLRDQVLPALE